MTNVCWNLSPLMIIARRLKKRARFGIVTQLHGYFRRQSLLHGTFSRDLLYSGVPVKVSSEECLLEIY